MVPDVRLRAVNGAPERPDGDFVLYWMIAARRTRRNFALDRAVEHAERLGKPLIVLEALRVGYRWASDRLHRFVLQGMAANRDRLASKPALYFPYVEREEGEGAGLLEALAADACVVVTDEFPSFFLPHMVAAAGRKLGVRLEAVDSNGLLPLACTDRVFTTAFSFRAFLQKELPDHLERFPSEDPFRGAKLVDRERMPAGIARRWPAASDALLEGSTRALARLPIDHEVAPVELEGGAAAGSRAAREFVDDRLLHYGEERNHPDARATSRLSPYLHFGHLSVHEVFRRVVAAEDWSPEELGADTSGKREGWWGMGASAEGFLDQLVTWRELGYHFCAKVPGHDRYETLPDWARATLAEHAADPREHLYSLEELEEARTHDELWNAAQRQLRREGSIHNYLRMLWGKKVLEWTTSPRKALEVLIELNDRYALDGRNPNSYSGIFWTLGRFDRAWGPERRVFGKVRCMTSRNTARKVRLKTYLERYAE